MARWDPKSFLTVSWQWPADALEPIGSAAVRRIRPLVGGMYEGAPARFGSVHFDGTVSERPPERAPATAYVALPGEFVFSKIDARNGAFGLVPSGSPLCFSAEYPVYDFTSSGKLRADFVDLLVRTSAFRSRVKAAAVGHTGRQRLAPQEFESIQVPVPDVSTQGAIVDWFTGKEVELQPEEARAAQLETEATAVLLAQTGTIVPPIIRPTVPLVPRYSDLDRWSPAAAAYKVLGVAESITATYPVVALGGVAKVAYGIAKNPANRPGTHPQPYLRVANVQAGVLDLTVMKTIDVPPALVSRFALQHGDLLVCEGNSADLVGRPAMWRDELPLCVHQNHVLRVRVDRENLDPEFLLAYMNSVPARRYFRRRAKRTTNLSTISGTDVKELPLPLPPLDVQKTIVGEIAELVREAHTVRENLLQLRKQLAADLAHVLSSGDLDVLTADAPV
jgi:type I restriction enzyme S subunit